MSSFSKNIIPRRIHKERAQPAARIAKHGLLEKKKDYKLRAKDHNRKVARLKLLREKASFRNPDEFYYAMGRKSTQHGVIIGTTDQSHENAIPLQNRSRDQRLLVETKDSRHVAYKLAVEKGKVKTLENHLHSISAARTVPRKHIIFADDEDEADEVLAQRSNLVKEVKELPGRLAKRQERAYRKLAAHSDRCDKLNTVYHDMTVEKNLLSKGGRTLVRKSDKESGAPPLFRWKQERSR